MIDALVVHRWVMEETDSYIGAEDDEGIQKLKKLEVTVDGRMWQAKYAFQHTHSEAKKTHEEKAIVASKVCIQTRIQKQKKHTSSRTRCASQVPHHKFRASQQGPSFFSASCHIGHSTPAGYNNIQHTNHKSRKSQCLIKFRRLQMLLLKTKIGTGFERCFFCTCVHVSCACDWVVLL